MRLKTALGLIITLLGYSVPTVLGEKLVVCYLVAWAITRLGDGMFSVDDVRDAHQCTHVIYAFMGVNAGTSEIRSIDKTIDILGRNQLQKLTNLKAFNNKLKISLSVGGYNERGEKFSDLAREPKRRATFINSVLSILRKYNLDGLDICWQFPGKAPGRGGREDDKENSVTLFREIKEAFKPDGFLLSIHVLGKKYIIDEYNITAVAEIVDFINLIPVEFSGPWERTTGIMAPLGNGREKDSVAYAVKYVVNIHKCPPNKIILGLPLYGHAFLLDEPPSKNNLIRLYSDKTFQGPWTNQDGVVGFHESCKFFKEESGWEQVWDEKSCTPIAINDKKLISYDNERSLLLKADLINKHALGGVMFWSLDMDDFKGQCFGEKFPMVSSISDFINGRRNDSLPKPTCQEEGNDSWLPVRFVPSSHNNSSVKNQTPDLGSCQEGRGFCVTLANCSGAAAFMKFGWKPESCPLRFSIPLICCPAELLKDYSVTTPATLTLPPTLSTLATQTTPVKISPPVKVPEYKPGASHGILPLHKYPDGETRPIWPSDTWKSTWHNTWSINYHWKTSSHTSELYNFPN